MKRLVDFDFFDFCLHLQGPSRHTNMKWLTNKFPDFLIIGSQKGSIETLSKMFDSMHLGCSGDGPGGFWSHTDSIDHGFRVKLSKYLSSWDDCEVTEIHKKKCIFSIFNQRFTFFQPSHDIVFLFFLFF